MQKILIWDRRKYGIPFKTDFGKSGKRRDHAKQKRQADKKFPKSVNIMERRA